VTLKTLVTGMAAAVVVGGAAAGVTSIASPAGLDQAAPATVAVSPVVWDIPMPQAPAPELQSSLQSTLTVLAGPGSFSPSGNKAAYIQGGTGRIEGITADRAYNNAARDGVFPLRFDIQNIDQAGGMATATVTATASTGVSRTENVQFFLNPASGIWQLSKGSALSLLSSV
jgi:hypothetical protein